MATGALILVLVPSLFVWLAGYEIDSLPLVALAPMAIGVLGWIGARVGRPGLTLASALLLVGYIVAITRVMTGVLPLLFAPGAMLMFMAANLMRGRPGTRQA